MAITKIQSESLNLADDYAFTGTITGAGGVMTPLFFAYKSSNQNISHGVNGKVTFDSELFDADNVFDSTTNSRFTVPSDGKYIINVSAQYDHTSSQALKQGSMWLVKNGSNFYNQVTRNGTTGTYTVGGFFSIIVDVVATDYFEFYSYVETTTGSGSIQVTASNYKTFFSGYKIIE